MPEFVARGLSVNPVRIAKGDFFCDVGVEYYGPDQAEFVLLWNGSTVCF